MIAVNEIKQINQGILKAFVKIDINGTKIHDFRIVQQKWTKSICERTSTAIYGKRWEHPLQAFE